MTLSALLDTVQAAGVELAVVDGELRYKGARGALTDDLRTQIRERKAEITASLARDPHSVPSAPCAACGGVAWRAESRDWRWQWVYEQCRPEGSAEESASLPPVHDADDPWTKPTAPCMVCGRVRWRVWCHDERKVWQWLCCACRPLVVINPDGTRWRS